MSVGYVASSHGWYTPTIDAMQAAMLLRNTVANNRDRITALDSVRVSQRVIDDVRKHGPYGYKKDKPPRDPIATLILWLSWLTIGGLVAWGIWGHFTDPDPYASRVIAECREGGGMPKVEKAQNGAVLGVRCEAMLP